MYSIGHSPSRSRFEVRHHVAPGGFNPSMETPRFPQRRGPSYILNGERIYDPKVVFAKAKALGPVVVQFVSKSGRVEEARTCANLLTVAAAIPQSFEGGYVTVRGSMPNLPAHRHVRRSRS